MASPIISVIIPVFNRDSFVRQTIASVLGQSFHDFELIIVNDGSTDRSADVIKSFSDQRICYLEQENKGLAATWNVGLGLAKARFIKLLDSDDYLSPTFLEEHLEFAERHPEAGVVHSNWYVVNETGAVIGDYRIGRVDDLLFTLLLGNVFGVHEMLFHRRALETVGWFDASIRICEDWDLFIQLAKSGCQFVHLNRFLSYHRVHDSTYKKLVRNRFQQVIEKTFLDGELSRDLLSLGPICEARHALFLFGDYTRWGWTGDIDGCLKWFATSLKKMASRVDAREVFRSRIAPIWPYKASGWVYVHSYRPRLKELGVTNEFMEVLDKHAFWNCLKQPVRILKSLSRGFAARVSLKKRRHPGARSDGRAIGE